MYARTPPAGQTDIHSLRSPKPTSHLHQTSYHKMSQRVRTFHELFKSCKTGKPGGNVRYVASHMLPTYHSCSSRTSVSTRTQVYTTQTLMTHFIHLLISGTCLERKERTGKRGRKEAHQLLVCKQNRSGTLTPPLHTPLSSSRHNKALNP